MKLKKIFLVVITLVIIQFTQAQEMKLTVPISHENPIKQVNFSPDGKNIVSTANDNMAIIWDIQTGKSLHILSKDSSKVFKAIYSPDGKYIITLTTKSKNANIWNSQTGDLLHSLKGHKGDINDVIFSPDGKTILTSSNDGSAKMWDCQSGDLLYTYVCDKKYTFIHKSIYNLNAKQIITIGYDYARVYDMNSTELLFKLKCSFRRFILSPDGKYFIVESSKPKIFDSKTGKRLNTFEGYFALEMAKYSPDGKNIITVPYNGTTVIRNSQNGKILYTLNRHSEKTEDLEYSPDGRYIVTALDNGTTKIWDSQNGKLLHTLDVESKKVNDVEYSPDGKYIVTASDDGTVKIWDAQTGNILQQLQNVKSTEIISAKYNPNGKNFATLSTIDNSIRVKIASFINKTIYMNLHDNTAKVFDSQTGRLLYILNGHKAGINTLDYSPDGKCIITASSDKTVKIWDSESGVLLYTKVNKQYVQSAKYSPNGKMILVHLSDSIYKYYSGLNDITEVWDSHTLNTLYSHADRSILYPDFTLDSKYFTTERDGAKTDALISVDKYKPFGSLLLYGWLYKFGPNQQMIFLTINIRNLSSNTLYFTSGSSKKSDNGIILKKDNGHLYNANTDILRGHTSFINYATFSPDGKNIISVSDDATGIIWDTETRRPLHILKGHRRVVKMADYSPDGKYIITASADGSIIVWDAKTGKKIVQKFFYDDGEYVVLSPEGYFDGTPEAIKQLYFVKGLEIIPLDAYYEQFYRPNLWERLLNGEDIEKATINFADQKPLPKIKITNPSTGEIQFRGSSKFDLSTAEKDFNFEYKITDNGGGIKEVRIFQNGKLVNTEFPNINQKDKTISGSFKLSLLQGENKIKLTVFNLDQIGKSETCLIEYTGKTQEPAKLYVLVIGLNEYKKSTYNLNYAVADASAFKQAIENGSKDIFADVNITFLKNSQASKTNIIRAFNDIKAKTTQSDVFIFYYAGHGSMSVVKEGEKEMFYILPYDVTNMYSQEILKANGVSASELKEFSKNIKAQKQLFVLDACQSGGAVDLMASRGALEEKAMAILARSTGTYWLTASGSEQLAGEFGTLGHGVFTYSVLEALSGKADAGKDGKVSVKELSLYVETEVPVLSEKYKGKEQFPVSYGFGQDFPVVLSNKYVIDTEQETTKPEETNIQKQESKAEGKYAKFSIEELKKMKAEAAENENYDLAKELKMEIEKRK